MKQSFLINDRIYLRAVEPEDIDIMYEMENDPLMWDISSFTVPYSRYVLRQYIEGSQSDMFADKDVYKRQILQSLCVSFRSSRLRVKVCLRRSGP